jgi:hypothetical protein
MEVDGLDDSLDDISTSPDFEEIDIGDSFDDLGEEAADEISGIDLMDSTDEIDIDLDTADPFMEEQPADEAPVGEEDVIQFEDVDMALEDDISAPLADDALSLADDDLSLADDALSPADDDLTLADDDLSLADDDLSLADDDLALDDFSELDLDTPAADELETLREEGATHSSPPPDNVSYLEDDNLSDDGFDLSDAVIDEPELSADNISDSLSEPTLEETEFDMDALDDLTIDDNLTLDDDLSIDDASDIDIPLEEEVAEAPAEDDMGDFLTDSLDDFQADEPQVSPPDEIDLDDDWDQPAIDPNWRPPQEEPAPQPAPSAPQVVFVQQPAVQPAASAPVAAAQPTPTPQAPEAQDAGKKAFQIPTELKSELRNILSYMDQLLESLPENKIEEFAKSDYFDSYKKLFKELGLV